VLTPYIDHSPEKEDIFLLEMFFRHHNRSPGCENYIRWLFLFCNQNIAIVWLGGKSANGGNIGKGWGRSRKKRRGERWRM